MKRIALLGLSVATISTLAACANESEHDMSIRLGEAAVRAGLKDPESATFRDVFVSANWNVCGSVNSKNSFGGYSGFTRFIVHRIGDYPYLSFVTPQLEEGNFAIKDGETTYFEQVIWSKDCIERH